MAEDLKKKPTTMPSQQERPDLYDHHDPGEPSAEVKAAIQRTLAEWKASGEDDDDDDDDDLEAGDDDKKPDDATLDDDGKR